MRTHRISAARQLVSAFVGLASSVGVFGAGLLMGRPAIAGQEEPTPQLGRPVRLGAGTGEVDLGASHVLSGMPTRLSLFWTMDESSAVAALYADAWEAAGLEVQVRQFDRVTSVSAADAEAGILRTVTIMDAGDDRLVLPSVVDLGHLPSPSPAGAPFPVPDDASVFLSNQTDEGTRATFIGNFLSASSPANVQAFYARELTLKGYKADPNASSVHDGARTSEWVRGAERVSVVATPTQPSDPATSPSMVVVHHDRDYGVTR